MNILDHQLANVNIKNSTYLENWKNVKKLKRSRAVLEKQVFFTYVGGSNMTRNFFVVEREINYDGSGSTGCWEKRLEQL